MLDMKFDIYERLERFRTETARKRRPLSRIDMSETRDLFLQNEIEDDFWGLSYYEIKRRIDKIKEKWACVNNVCTRVPLLFKQAFERVKTCKF